jgi:hypothetical protein
MSQAVCSTRVLVPAIRQATRGLLVLAMAALLGACEKTESSPAAAAPVMKATFECPVPESLRGKVEKVFFEAKRVGEPPGKDASFQEGGFSTDFIGLMRPGGATTVIRLDEVMVFSAKSLALHAGCEQFKWKTLGDVTLFEYTYGSGDPYHAQQLMYSRGPKPDFENLWKLLPAGDVAFYSSERGNSRCLAGLSKGDGEVERWCYADGKLEQTRKMFKVAHAEGEFRYTCDFSGDGPLMIEASILKPGADSYTAGRGIHSRNGRFHR